MDEEQRFMKRLKRLVTVTKAMNIYLMENLAFARYELVLNI
jgi:hypothetical protein